MFRNTLYHSTMERINCSAGSGPGTASVMRRHQCIKLCGIPSRHSGIPSYDRSSVLHGSKDGYISRSTSGYAASASGEGQKEDCPSCQATMEVIENLPMHYKSDIGDDTQTPHDVLMAILSKFSRNRYKAITLTAASCVALPCGLVDVSSHLHTAWNQISSNYVFVVGFWGWFLAQFFKIFTKWYKTGIFSPSAFFDSGGMPSSHSSLCSAMTTAVAQSHGLGSSLFAACTCFTVIVMYDAMGVRRHAGLQAQVLNAVVNDLLEGHPVSERKLKEVLGHTPRQVLCGGILGILVGLLFPH